MSQQRPNTNAGVTVAATSTTVLPARVKRHYAAIVNDSNEEIYLARGTAAVANKGIRLNALGGSYEIDQANPFDGEVNAICASGSKVLTIVEEFDP
jgi:hypothetical protein